MLELDTTIMTPASVFETSGHVARFADWMVKDKQTGDVLRADHLVKNVLEARLEGDKEARGGGVAAPATPSADDKKKKKKKNVKSTAVKLDDGVVKEYEVILAQVRFFCFGFFASTAFATIWFQCRCQWSAASDGYYSKVFLGTL
jgi:glycyl-tRNA synthetase